MAHILGVDLHLQLAVLEREDEGVFKLRLPLEDGESRGVSLTAIDHIDIVDHLQPVKLADLPRIYTRTLLGAAFEAQHGYQYKRDKRNMLHHIRF